MLLGWKILSHEKLDIKSKTFHIAGVINTHLTSADVEMHFMTDYFLLYKRQSESECAGHSVTAYGGTDRRWRYRSYRFSAQHWEVGSCLVLGQQACTDTIMTVMRHCKMPCTSGCRGGRATCIRQEYMLAQKIVGDCIGI
jgi:hypothetical protein